MIIRPYAIEKQQYASNLNILIYRHCNLRSSKSVDDAPSTATCVFHLGSYGMSGKEMLNSSMIYEVTVIGTDNIMNGCIRHNIKKNYLLFNV